MHPICLPTLEGGLVVGLLATEAVTPMVYSRPLTNKLGGCLVTLCSWGAHLSSVHTPVSSNLPIIVVSRQVTASLRSTTSVGEQAYSDHVGGRPATGQSKQGAQWSHSHSAFACHHWFGQTETETLVMTRTSWEELDVEGHILTYLSCSSTSFGQKSIKRFVIIG